MGFWVEIVTLLIPGFNDSRDELTRLTAFVAGVSPDIPWHVTAFHGDYKMTDPAEHDRRRCCWRAADDRPRAAGLRYVYAGNLPGQVGDLEDTRCASCGELLIARYGYHDPRLPHHARRPLPVVRDAGARAAGARGFAGQIASRPFVPAGIQDSDNPIRIRDE